MTEPREPYIAGRKKVITAKIAVPFSSDGAAQLFFDAFKTWADQYGISYVGLIEVSYEEE